MQHFSQYTHRITRRGFVKFFRAAEIPFVIFHAKSEQLYPVYVAFPKRITAIREIIFIYVSPVCKNTKLLIYVILCNPTFTIELRTYVALQFDDAFQFPFSLCQLLI